MKNRAIKYTIGFAAIGIIIILLVSYVQRKTLNNYHQNIPFISLGDHVKNRTTNAYLSFEKILEGDTTLDFDKDVIRNLALSQNILQKAYDGGITPLGEFEESDDLETKVHLKKAIHAIEKVTDAARARWIITSNSIESIKPQIQDTIVEVQDSVSTDSTIIADSTEIILPEPTQVEALSEGNIDEAMETFKTAYQTFQIVMNRLGGYVDKKVQRDVASIKILSWLATIAIIIVFIILGVLLYRVLLRNGKRIKENEQRLATQANAVDQLSGFIDAVSAGDYSVALELAGDDDGNLTNKLVTMRDKLKENAESERKRGWSTMGLAQIGEILRVTTNVTELYDNIIRFVVKYTKSNQGGLFIINEQDEGQRETYLELASCYAYERKKFLTKKIAPGEGQVGLCFQEGQRIYLVDVPNEYIYITSGLGSTKPKALLLVPMKINGEVYGVIELATFYKYEDFEIELIEKLAESIASTISTVRVNESTRILLEKTQQQAEEMKSQEEEIRQNIEELEATQEEMRRKQDMLEKELRVSLDQIDTLKEGEHKLLETHDTFQSIVDHVPSAIFWKDKDLRYIGCNKIFLEKTGFTSSQEILGKTDFEMPWSTQADAYRVDELEVLRKRQPKFMEEEKTNNHGEKIYTRTTKVAILNTKREPIAMLGIIEDITKLKHNNQEAG